MPHQSLIVGIILMLPLLLPASAHAQPTAPRAVLDIHQMPPPGETLVWSPLFQASWDKMKQDHHGRLLRVEPPNPLINAMNQFQWQEKRVMPTEGYATFSGRDTEEFRNKVAKIFNAQFGMNMPPRTSPYSSQANAYYGILARDLRFNKRFYRSKNKPLKFTDSHGKIHSVHFFGTAKRNSKGYDKNIRILRNDPEKNTFILSVTTHKEGEKILIYQPSAPESFAEAIRQVYAAQNTPCDGKFPDPTYPYLIEGDIIKIPHLQINSQTDLTSSLKGDRFYEGDRGPWSISWAYQITNFKLTEKGAQIRVQTGMDDAFGGAPKPRQFICDRPFFVFAWREKAKLPYFAAWIDGKSALQPFRQKP